MAGLTEPVVQPYQSAAALRPAFLRVAHLDKTFTRRVNREEQHLKVLDDVSLDAARGEFVTVIGPSGCGKSTLLNCVAGLTDYDGGTIDLDGVAIAGPGADRAVVFQQASLLPWRTVQRNVAYGLELRRELSSHEIAERVAAVLELVGLKGFEAHFPHEISGGMQQRTNLARALAVDPKLVLMDEPFGALDALTKETLQDELSALAGHIERTTVFITHDIDEAVYLGDKVIVMTPRPGRILAQIDVPFARPRARSVTETERFNQLVHELRALLQGPARVGHDEERS
ncbi:MAG: NitT/TauT family transport system ATP-binding protein [Solirubrobacteraceae bacterium]